MWVYPFRVATRVFIRKFSGRVAHAESGVDEVFLSFQMCPSGSVIESMFKLARVEVIPIAPNSDPKFCYRDRFTVAPAPVTLWAKKI